MCYNAFDMSASKKRILLVEDDNFLNQLYTDLLKKEGYEVTSVIDGETALEKIQTNSWDLILLDIVLPGKSGFEVFAEVSKKSKPKYPIIFMTNLDSSDKDKKQLEQATGYWTKSNMSPPEFIANVKKILH